MNLWLCNWGNWGREWPRLHTWSHWKVWGVIKDAGHGFWLELMIWDVSVWELQWKLVCVCVCFPPLQASHLSVHFHLKDALYVHNFGYCRNELSGITFGFEKSLPCIHVLPLELKRVAMRNSSIVCDLKVEAVQGNLLNFCLLQCTGENGPSACLTTAKTWKAYARYSRCS